MYSNLNKSRSLSQSTIKYNSIALYFFKKVNLIFALYVIIYIISPPLKSSKIYLFFLLASILIWFLTALLWDPVFFIRPKRIILAIYFFFTYFCTSLLITSNGLIIKRFFGIIMLFFIQIMYMFYYKNHREYISKLSKLILLLVPIFSAISIYYVNMYPYIIRNVLKANSPYSIYLALGVGGYDYVYFLVIIVPACVYILKYGKQLTVFWRFIYIINSIIGTIFIIKAGFTLALLTFTVSLLIVFFIKKMNFSGFIYLLIIIIVIYLCIPYILVILYNITNNTLYATKIKELSQHFIYGSSFRELSTRISVYNLSIRTFFDNPFFGYVYRGKIYLGFSNNIVFGQHSAIFDIFALFGGFIGFMLIYILWATPISFLKKFKNLKSNSLIWVTLFSTIVILTFNNDIPFLGLAIYFVLYAILDKVSKNN